MRQQEFESQASEWLLPFFLEGLCAGFPSPADDHLEPSIDLLELLIPNRPATFLWRVDGHSMRDAGIFHDDILIVDRSLEARDGDVVVAIVNGERSLKRLRLDGRRPRLTFENSDYPDTYAVPDDAQVEVWGVVRANVHLWRGRR